MYANPIYIYTLPSFTTFIFSTFGTGGLWYRGEGHLLKTLHPINLDLTSSMSKRKKSQAWVSVPLTPEGEEDHAHSLGTH